MDRRHLLTIAPTVAAVALAVLPAVVVFGFGWLSPAGSPSAGSVTDRAPEAWVLFALFYLMWMGGLMALLIVANDRLGRHWRSWDRHPRPEKRQRRRLAAGMRYLEGQQRARAAEARGGRPRAARAHDADPRAASSTGPDGRPPRDEDDG